MTIRQIMRSRQVICTVPDERARAVLCSLQGPVTPNARRPSYNSTPTATVFIDQAAARCSNAESL
jgi:hypothetical protein